LTLGGASEINCQFKMIFLTLWELGWDPVHQLFLNFQIAKEHMQKSPRMASAAADIVAATQEGIYLVCEVKYWNNPNLTKFVTQVKEYQEALNAPMACLTNGRRWIVFAKNSEVPLMDMEYKNTEEMFRELRKFISPEAIRAPSPYPYPDAFKLGISIAKKTSTGVFDLNNEFHSSSLWETGKYPNLSAKKFVDEMKKLSQENATTIRTDESGNSIFLKGKKSGKKLIEYHPLTNMIVNTHYDHGQLGVPIELSRKYHEAVKKYGRPVTNT